MIRYELIKQTVFSHDIGSFTSFGIQAVMESPENVIKTVSDISTNPLFVQNIIDTCTKNELSPIHLDDVIQDKLFEM